ncbi:hypothetical protein RRF57_002084 [Xylaria bambusicola]|uniref:Uncharacterized protein n=1 Tax=Xylaria bambusicola TaxID=326684 RepID=A0AAN7UIA4_9PEZI
MNPVRYCIFATNIKRRGIGSVSDFQPSQSLPQCWRRSLYWLTLPFFLLKVKVLNHKPNPFLYTNK